MLPASGPNFHMPREACPASLWGQHQPLLGLSPEILSPETAKLRPYGECIDAGNSRQIKRCYGFPKHD